MIDDVIVGHGIAVGGDEEAGADAGDDLMALHLRAVAAAPNCWKKRSNGVPRKSVRHVLIFTVAAQHAGVGRFVELHADRDDGRFYLADQIRKAVGTLLRLRRGRRGMRALSKVSVAHWAKDKSGTENGDGTEQRDAPGSERLPWLFM